MMGARAFVAGAVLIGLSACGFHPLYGDNGALSADMSSIYVEPIEDRTGYELRNTLIDLLQSDGRSEGKAYHLKLTLDTTSQGIALQNDATITRYNDRLVVDYVLTDGDQKTVKTGKVSGLSSYNVVSSPYATQIAQQDADKRAAEDIAVRIRLELGVYFTNAGKR